MTNTLLPSTFYTDVDKPLNYVIYGDSVTEDMTSIVMIGQTWQKLSFKEIWDLVLKHEYEVIYRDGKEYICLDMNNYSFNRMQTVAYNFSKKNLSYKPVQYIMRHKINKEIYELNINDLFLKLTNDHSLMDIVDNSFIEVKPEDATHVLYMNDAEVIRRKITSKKKINYEGYVYDLCVPETQNFTANDIIVHNTDSLYVNIPQLKPKSSEEAVEMANDISYKINSTLKHIMDTQILPSMGIDPQYNYTEFKTELVCDAIIFLASKKSYAYRKLAQEGKIMNPPEISYTGISVKSDISKWSRDFIRGIIENIALNPEIEQTQGYSLMNQYAISMKDKLVEAIESLEVNYIGIPKKWGSGFKGEDPWQVIGMRLYNTITNSKTLTPMSPAFLLPIQIKNPTDFETKISGLRHLNDYTIGDIPIAKLNYIGFPYNCDVEMTKNCLKQYGIVIDFQDVWDKIYNKQASEIVKIQQNSIREQQYSSVRG